MLIIRYHLKCMLMPLGAVLYQKRDEKLDAMAYASRCLKPPEVNYSAYKRELLSLKWGITDNFHDDLYGSRYKVWTDCNPLTYGLTSAKVNVTCHRWLAKLAWFDFEIKYKSMKTNTDVVSLQKLQMPSVLQVIWNIVFLLVCLCRQVW